MHRLIYTICESAIASVVLIPVYCRLNQCRFHNRQRSICYLLFSIYLSAVYAVAGLPNITYIRFQTNHNFTPFLHMFSAFETSFLNVILFIPLGLFMVLLWKPFRNGFRCMLAGFIFSSFVEALQIFTLRATDVNDLITNTLGTLLGWSLGRFVIRFYSAPSPFEKYQDFFLILGIVFGNMFFLHPHLSQLIHRLLLNK